MVFEHIRTFLVNICVFPWGPLPPLLHNVFHFHLYARIRHALSAIMGIPIGTKAVEPIKRHMLHLKTKEECRLGNETIRVWTVELPSKHAEGILKCDSFYHSPCNQD